MSIEKIDDLIPGVELIQNKEQRTACGVVVDASASMSGGKIRSLNSGLKCLMEALRADDQARKDIHR